MFVPIPKNDAERLQALRRLSLLDSPPEEELDQLVKQVSQVLQVPVALLTLVDADRQWNMATHGTDLKELPREHSFCAHAVADGNPLVVEDASLDPRFADNPFVAQDPRLRFYAGVPLRSTDGFALGTLCAIDVKPRRFTAQELSALKGLAGIVEAVINLRLRLHALEKQQDHRSFVEMAIHDLKNPLFVVMSIAALAKDAPDLFREDATMAMDLLESAHELNSRMSGVLDLVSTNAGHGIPLQSSKVNAKQLVEDVVARLQRMAAADSMTMSSTVPEDLPMMQADVNLLHRVLENLISNALKYSCDGKCVEVAVASEPGQVVFSVRDHGSNPIPEALRTSVFNPFDRGANHSAPGSQGLGLAFCQAAVTAHKGKIWIETPEDGKGSLFRFTIPTARAAN